MTRSAARLGLLLVVLTSSGAARSDDLSQPETLDSAVELSDLRAIVQQQGQLIEALQEQVRELRAQPPGNTAGDEQVTTAYVDERIEDFEVSPASRFLVSGYGTAFLADSQDEKALFGLIFNPSFHFRMAEQLHFNAELEIELEVEDGELDTHFGLEFAQVDYLATDWLMLTGGKFLTPFNTFGPRLHPTWINKLASAPPIYGGHEGGGMIPVLQSVGALASGGTALWSDDAKINYAVYAANGAVAEPDPMEAEELLEIEFDNTPDLDNVSAGGRIGLLPIGNLELGVSYMTGSPNDDRFDLVGADAWYFWQGLELRGELAYLTRDAVDIDADVWGYWAQAAYRLRYLFPDRAGWRGFLNRLEGVVRWGQILDEPSLDREQLALGLNFWLFESAPLKLNYEINNGSVDANRFVLQFAYGF